MNMRFGAGQSSDYRELDDIRQRIAQLRSEIVDLDARDQSADDTASQSESYTRVRRLRESMRRGELEAKRAELDQLLAREEELCPSEPAPEADTPAAVAEPVRDFPPSVQAGAPTDAVNGDEREQFRTPEPPPASAPPQHVLAPIVANGAGQTTIEASSE